MKRASKIAYFQSEKRNEIFRGRLDNRFLLIVVYLFILFPIIQLDVHQILLTSLFFLFQYYIGKRLIDFLIDYVPNYFLYLGLIFSVSSIFLPIFIIFTTIHLKISIYLSFLILLFLVIIFGIKNNVNHQSKYESVSFSNILIFIISISIGIIPIVANLYITGNLFHNNFSSLHPDLLTFETISNSISNFGLIDTYFATGFEIKYHWMAYSWAGNIAQFADLPPFFSLIKLLPLFSLISGTLIIFGILQHYKQGNRTFLISAILYSISVYIFLKNGSLLNFDSPSQSLTSVWALSFFSLTLIEHCEKFVFGKFILLFIFLSGITLGKPSFLVPLFGGILFYLLYGVKKIDRRYIGYALMYVLLFAISLCLIKFFLLGNTSAIGGLEIGDNSSKIPFILLGEPKNILDFLGVILLFLFFISPKFLWMMYLPLLLKNHFKISLFTLGSFSSMLLFIFVFGDSSFSRVNLMWFVLAGSTLSLPLMSITSNIVVTKLIVQKTRYNLMLVLLGTLFSIFLNSKYSLLLLNQDLLLIVLVICYILVVISMMISLSIVHLKSFTFIFILSASIFSRFFSTEQLNIEEKKTSSSAGRDLNNFSLDSNTNEELIRAALFLRSNKSLIGEKIATNLDENYLLPALSKTKFHNSAYDSLFLIGTGITVKEIYERRAYFQNLFSMDNQGSISYFCSNGIDFILTDINKPITSSVLIKRFNNISLIKLPLCKY
jgi:hypothetical protein